MTIRCPFQELHISEVERYRTRNKRIFFAPPLTPHRPTAEFPIAVSLQVSE
jgi:hypothetical protein